MSSKADNSSCPSIDALAQLATGSLVEEKALAMFDHMDSCPECQNRYDELENQGDGILRETAKHQGDNESTTGPTNLTSLIRRAKQLEAIQPTKKPQGPKRQAVSRDGFIDALRRCGLLPTEEIELCLDEIDSDSSLDTSESSSLAKALVKRQKLTPFQARVLLQGKSKGLVLGKYSILDRVGKGGMGDVFKAKHRGMDRIVCLKIVNSSGRQSPQVIERFQNEAKALAALSHPNIVVAHDADECRGIPFLVMEHIEGNDLAKTVRANGPFSWDDALRITTDVANALEYAHGQGVIHRDIKPHNIVLTDDQVDGEQVVKVLDLGLARFDSMLTDDPDASLLASMTNTGVVVGTVDYMSPEQALDSRTADVRSDIYSLGCTMCFLLTGQPPYQGNTIMQRLVAHREQQIPTLDDVEVYDSDQFADFLQRMLAKDPNARYQSMKDVLADLDHLTCGQPLGGFVTQTPEVESLSEPVPPEKDRKLWKVAFAVATVVLTVATFVSMVPPDLWNGGNYAVSKPTNLIGPEFQNGQYVSGNKRYDRDRAIKNGGNGRVLLIVPSENYDRTHYRSLANNLADREIELVVASPKFGPDNAETLALRQDSICIDLETFQPSDFDVLFLIGGEKDDLRYRSPNDFELVRDVVRRALDNRVNVATIGDGWEVVRESGVCSGVEPSQDGSVTVYHPDDVPTIVQCVDSHVDVGILIARSLKNLAPVFDSL